MSRSLLDALERPIDALLTIDFETFYGDGYTLSKKQKMTNEAYVRDPRFETIGVGVKINADESVWMTEEHFKAWASQVNWDRIAVLAHNAHFDGLILSHHFNIKPGFWCDTLSMARALHGMIVGNSLAKLLPYYGFGEKGFEVHAAKGKHRADFTPEEYAAYGMYCRNDCNGTYDIFQKMLQGYGPNGPFPEIELWNIDTTIRMFTEPSFILNEPLLTKALAEEKQKKAELLARVGKDKSIFMSNDKFAALLTEMGEDPPLKVSLRTGKDTFALAKTDPGMQDLLEHERDEIRWVAEARLGVKSTINETRTERFLRMGVNGRPVPVYLKYSAAHTHRWGGGDKTNFQNLQRGGVLRDSLLAPAGATLVVADSGQIEARVVGWFAGHTALLDVFRRNDTTGGDFYSDVGSQYFGKPLSKKETPVERQISKSMVLGLGFGMGWAKFAAELLKGMLGNPPVQFTAKEANAMGVDTEAFGAVEWHMHRISTMPSRIPLDQRVIHCAVASAFVDLYRAKNPPIVDVWELCNNVLKAMASAEEATFGPGGCLQIKRHRIVLPNQMTLHYPGLEWHSDQRAFTYLGGKSGKSPTKAYGGSVTENIVQALARIIVAEQILSIRAIFQERYKPFYRSHNTVVTMTHDEGVFLVPEQCGDEALQVALAEMRKPPSWAQDLPLNAEGAFAKSYGDAK